MKELEKYEILKVLKLYLKSNIDFPLIRAVIERKQDGRSWVDRKNNPLNALVCSKFGFTYLFGDGNNQAFESAIEKLIFEDSGLQYNYLLWYDPPKVWCDKMDLMPDDIARKRERIKFKFNKRIFADFLSKQKELPRGFTVKRLDDTLIEKSSVFNLDIESRFWASANDFLSNGFGHCVLENDKIVSICYSACIVNSVTEIDVATLEQYRGMGLATIASSAFIEYCIENKITPNWDCFDYNEPSLRLAKILGFEEEVIYPFYSVNRL